MDPIEDHENTMAAAAYLYLRDKLEYCQHHDQYHGGGWDFEKDFWPLATHHWKQKDAGPVGWAKDMELREFTDYLKQANEEYVAESCYFCDKMMRD